MLPATDDTIAAVASPHGGAARGIVRISGPDTLDAPAVATDPTATGTLPAEAAPVAIRVGQPHLTDSAPLAGPSPAQAVKNPATAPAPPQNPLDILSALP